MEQPDIGGRLILARLHAQEKQLQRIDERLRHIEISIGILKTKAAAFGAVAGFLPALLVWWFTRG